MRLRSLDISDSNIEDEGSLLIATRSHKSFIYFPHSLVQTGPFGPPFGRVDDEPEFLHLVWNQKNHPTAQTDQKIEETRNVPVRKGNTWRKFHHVHNMMSYIFFGRCKLNEHAFYELVPLLLRIESVNLEGNLMIPLQMKILCRQIREAASPKIRSIGDEETKIV